MASIYNNTDVIRMLLQHGATKDIENNFSDRPFDLARRENSEEAVRLLQWYSVSTCYTSTNHVLMFYVRFARLK